MNGSIHLNLNVRQFRFKPATAVLLFEASINLQRAEMTKKRKQVSKETSVQKIVVQRRGFALDMFGLLYYLSDKVVIRMCTSEEAGCGLCHKLPMRSSNCLHIRISTDHNLFFHSDAFSCWQREVYGVLSLMQYCRVFTISLDLQDRQFSSGIILQRPLRIKLWPTVP